MRRDVFQAIADPTRREIINLVASQPLNLNAIADKFDISRPSVSQHVRILVECGLIIIKKQGRERYCEPNFGPLREVNNWVAQHKKLWLGRFDAIENLLTEMQVETGDKKMKYE